MTFRTVIVFVLTLVMGVTISGCTREDGPMSPYAAPGAAAAGEPAGAAVRGATWEPGTDPEAELARMRDEFHIDTVTAYGLQDWPATRLDALLAALTRQRMRLVPRIEAYDPATFAFTAADARHVVDLHAGLLARTRASDRVAYVSVNMPVDDPRVQARLGGIGSALSQQRQRDYAAAVTRLLRERTGARIFLSLFYGWDGSYAVPSYRDSGADGYVLTNYSYPGDKIARSGSRTGDLIAEKQLRATADRAINDHPGAPMIVEYGFQTLGPDRRRPDQTAGLVRDEAAKRKALRETTRLYRDHYPAVIGTMYFGWNVHKAEGTPPRMTDYGLVPPPS